MEKVKLPHDVAEALNRILDGNEKRDVFNDFMGETIGADLTWESKTIYNHFKDDMFLLAQALINGYEVEETPEDQVRTLYKKYANATSGAYSYQCGYNVGARNAIPDVLNLLGIHIEGVNAE